jgi:hypothetical protein
MPDNLSISISADTSKARADLELLNAKVRELRKEVRAASNEANASGGMTARLTAATAELTAAEAQQKSYARATRATTVANVEASASFADLNKNMIGFARGAGQAIGGIKGLRAGLATLAGAAVIQSVTSLVDKITELSDLSKKTGFSTSTIQALGSALEKTGGHAEDAKGILEKLGSQVKLTFDIYGKAALTAGDGTDEFSKALAALRININQFKLGTEAGLDQFLTAVAQALVKLNQAGRIDEANILSVQLLGKNYREVGAALEKIVQGGGLDALKEALGASLVTPEQALRNKVLVESVNELKEAWTGLLLTLSDSGVFAVVAAGLLGIAEAVKAVAHAFGVSPGGDYGGGGDAAFASGGYVRGPGSGTSDSIMARLSNGEFVMRAAAVDRWGPQFLHALNNMRNPFGGFASGGLVSARSIPSFAGGGMVHTAGATVNLVFPGGTFAMRADNETVGALTREARRAGMLSGGRRAGLLQ